jgi:hypothetical protein
VQHVEAYDDEQVQTSDWTSKLQRDFTQLKTMLHSRSAWSSNNVSLDSMRRRHQGTSLSFLSHTNMQSAVVEVLIPNSVSKNKRLGSGGQEQAVRISA